MRNFNAHRHAEIVLAKLNAPLLPPFHVERPYLFTRFKRGLSWKFILVAAPIGYGKTTLLSEWYYRLLRDEEEACKVAWLTLDEEDADFIRLCGHLLASWSAIWPYITENNPLPDTDDDIRDYSVRLSNYLHKQMKNEPKRCVLFIDNLDALPPGRLSELLYFFAEYLPAGITVVSTGSFFPMDMIDFRFWDSVLEFPPSDLPFKRDEVAAFLEGQFGEAFPLDQADELYRLTEGWVTGVRLYVDSLNEMSVESHASLDVDALYPLVDRFFSSCVSREIPGELASFLLETSLVEKFNAPLCSHLTGLKDSQRFIDALIERRFFIEPIEGEERWYRYHPLFLRWLRTRLLQYSAGTIRELGSKACDWYESQKMSIDAAKYMLMANDSDMIENLAASANFKRADTEEPFISWICNTPAEDLPHDPTLSLLVTWGYMCNGRSKDTLKWLALFEKNLEEEKKNKADSFSAEDLQAASIVIQHVKIKCKEFDGFFKEAIEEYRNLLDQQDGTMTLSLRCVVVHALAESYERVGEFSLALEYYLQTEAIADLANSPFFVAFGRYAFCWVLAIRGELRNAEQACRRALEECPTDYTLYGALHALLAYIQIEKDEMVEAGKSLEKAMMRLSLTRNADMLFEANIVQANYLASLRKLDEAYRLIVQTVLLAESTGVPRGVLYFAYIIQVRIALQRNNIADAIMANEKIKRRIDPDDTLYVLRIKIAEARIQYAQGDLEDALRTIEELIEESQEATLFTLVIEALLLQVIIFYETGRKSEALSQLNKALVLSSRQGSIRPFIREGEPMRRVLHELVNIRKADGTVHLFAKSVLKAFKDPERKNDKEDAEDASRTSFTKREIEVLELLNTGMSRQEIAEALNVSHNTVKTHLNNIYSKLGVNNRADVFRLTSRTTEGSPS